MSTRKTEGKTDLRALDRLIEECTIDAYGDMEQLWAFRQVLEDNIDLPADAFVIGEPVSVTAIDYDGNERRGLTARCRREDGAEYVVAVPEVEFPRAAAGARYVAAYRRWLGLDPYPAERQKHSQRRRQHRATAEDIDPGALHELVVLSVSRSAARCRLPGSNRIITLRASRPWGIVPGELVTVQPRKQWSYAGHPYLSGDIQSARIDAKALDLEPLVLAPMGMWDPKEEYWGEEGEPVEKWARPIIAGGPRPMFEMEQVLPGHDPDDDPLEDPITRSNGLKDAGRRAEAAKILMELCEADLRCLDAHAHLGNFVFDLNPQDALRHYEVGLRIGELSLGGDFNGLLPWGLVDNRPFLRCMHGYGLCLWRLGRFGEAGRLFKRMLWLNPSDNQGVRFLIDAVKAKTPRVA
ncbi:MAG TPA: cytoplasmic protein [Syntrophales bacterium]|nr:cytoplasmic protein [Syntrophales bacterium]